MLVELTVVVIATFVSLFCDCLSQRNEMSNFHVLCCPVLQLTAQDDHRSNSASPVPVVIIEVSFSFATCFIPFHLFALMFCNEAWTNRPDGLIHWRTSLCTICCGECNTEECSAVNAEHFSVGKCLWKLMFINFSACCSQALKTKQESDWHIHRGMHDAIFGPLPPLMSS